MNLSYARASTLAATQLPIGDLVTAMQAGPATDGWDVVCSYTIDALNAVLAKAHADSSHAAELDLPRIDSEDPLSGEKFSVDFKIKLAPPELLFLEGVDGSCDLRMVLESVDYSLYDKDGHPTRIGSFDQGYAIHAEVPLVSITGDASAPGSVAQAGQIITWTEGGPTTSHVTLQFLTGPGQGVIWSLENPPSSKDRIFTPLLMQVLKDYFADNVKALDYAMAGVSAAPVSGSGTLLTPESFVFGCSGGVLNLFVQTKESGNPPGTTNPLTFAPGGTAVVPVPQGATASITFSRSLVWKVYPILFMTGAILGWRA
jgi:hypothetical protein